MLSVAGAEVLPGYPTLTVRMLKPCPYSFRRMGCQPWIRFRSGPYGNNEVFSVSKEKETSLMRSGRLMEPVVLMFLAILVGNAGQQHVFGQDEGKPTLEELRERGKTIYLESCADCHGEKGEGVEGAYEMALVGDDSIGQLAHVISRTMPEGSPEDCVGADAQAVSEYVHFSFYSEAAQIRNRPPRVSLARLTANQLRQSLADVYASFHGLPATTMEHGVKGAYYSDDDMRSKNKKLERVERVLDFDFGRESPVEELKPEEFGVRWEGGLYVEESGAYEIVVRSTCSFVMSFGHSGRELINNHVQSGDKTEFRVPLMLTAGRVYPFNISFRQRKRKTEIPPASFSFNWVTPSGEEQVVPNKNLLSGWAPPAYALQAKLPPDDRSYGYERGIAVNRDWDESTTAAALEISGVLYRELYPDFARRNKKKYPENRGVLRAFAKQFVSTALHGRLAEDELMALIDRQLAKEADDAEALKRICLVALKSPAFLYPLADADQSESQRIANRLSLVLFDSLPADDWIRKAAEKDEFKDAATVRAYAEKYVNDFRVRAKTREFLHSWLNLDHLSDLAKSEELYPEFDEALANDLRSSLDRFLDSVVWSDESDFRDFFQANESFTTSRIGEYYGGVWEPAEPSNELVRTAKSDELHGLLNHPLMMSGLAYHDTTSPIHRGVFLMRYLLGRTIRPPADAFSPLSPDLHPDLTTRERVDLQTSPESCQACHSKINGLGFVLENYDAVGKIREMERGKAVDTTGQYVSRAGDLVKFDGIGDLADYLANSEDSRRAFVSRAFQHFVKQPPAAFGADTLDNLTRQFSDNGCNITKLLVEISLVAVGPSTEEQAVNHEQLTSVD